MIEVTQQRAMRERLPIDDEAWSGAYGLARHARLAGGVGFKSGRLTRLVDGCFAALA
jgi:hypothetical protein